MKLTEREKWLMQQAWNVSPDYTGHTMDYWLSEDTGCNGADVEMFLFSNGNGVFPSDNTWTKCSDRMPPSDGRYLVVGLGGKITTRRYCTHHDDDYFGRIVATHWMPLPEPPQIEEIKDIIKLAEDSK